MPNYPSSFISGIAPGARAVDNVADKREIKFTQAVSVAFTAAGTVGTPATIHAATTANIALTGAQTIDGVSVSAGTSFAVSVGLTSTLTAFFAQPDSITNANIRIIFFIFLYFYFYSLLII